MITPRENYVRGPVWASEEVKSIWMPKLDRAIQFWELVERESVGVMRDSALVIATEKLETLSSWAAKSKRQLTFLAEAKTSGDMRVIVHVPSAELSRAWMDTWETGDDDRIGELLGYPKCCREFFARTWGQGSRDTTIQQFGGRTADGPIGCNLLLRWLGARLVPHLSCSYTCEQSAAQGLQFLELGERLGDTVGLAAIEELLSLPFMVSSLHGTMEIRTPHFKLEVDTDNFAERQEFSRAATEIKERHVEPTTWEDNGFNSRDAMHNAHLILSTVVPRTPRGSIMDLGCGDGTLLEHLRVRDNLFLATGVDVHAERIARGKKRYPQLGLVEGRIEDLTPIKTRTVLFMPGRLLEMNKETADKVRNFVLSFQQVVLYTYDDVKLEDVCERAKMPVPKHIVRSHGGHAQAGLVIK